MEGTANPFRFSDHPKRHWAAAGTNGDVLAGVLFLYQHDPQRFASPTIGGLGPLFFFISGLSVRAGRPFRKQILMDDPDQEHASVHIEYRAGEKGICLGTDEGVVTLFDGWLICEGLRTRFSLRKDDSVACGSESLSISTPAGDVYVSFTDHRKRDHPRTRRIHGVLDEWRKSPIRPQGRMC
ncbi:MAG TPA: hypothetical protein VG944_16280, partial [Fimbriimonas sp.]|nr:hypothetical protein [Fimbriimonas sp.]